MQNNNLTKLPAFWIIILAPFGILTTTLFFNVFGHQAIEIQKSLGIVQGRIFALLVYTFSTGIGVLLYYLLLKSKNLDFKKAGYRNNLTKNGIYGALICFVIAMFMYPLIEQLMKLFDLPMFWERVGNTSVKQENNQDIFLGILTAVILAPLTEDTIFRGYVLEMFNERFKKWIAIIISSFIFATIHFQFFGPGLTVYMLFWSILTDYLYVRFNNIYPSLLFHALNNVWAYVLVPLIF